MGIKSTEEAANWLNWELETRPVRFVNVSEEELGIAGAFPTGQRFFSPRMKSERAPSPCPSAASQPVTDPSYGHIIEKIIKN